MNLEQISNELNEQFEDSGIYEVVDFFGDKIVIELPEFDGIESIIIKSDGSIETTSLTRNDTKCTHVGHDYIAPTLFDRATGNTEAKVSSVEDILELIEEYI